MLRIKIWIKPYRENSVMRLVTLKSEGLSCSVFIKQVGLIQIKVKGSEWMSFETR